MNKETKKMVMGFVEYLQSIYGTDGTEPKVAPSPPNSLAIPMFVTSEDEDLFGSLGQISNVLMAGSPSMGAAETVAMFDSLTGNIPGDNAMGGMPQPMPGAGMAEDPMQQMMMMGM